MGNRAWWKKRIWITLLLMVLCYVLFSELGGVVLFFAGVFGLTALWMFGRSWWRERRDRRRREEETSARERAEEAALNRRREAARSYEGLQERLLTRMGVLPSDQLRELYRQSQRSRDPRAVSPVTLLERLQEPPHPGALICEYDFFRIVCHSMARMAGRSGEPLHIALISITGPEDAPLPRYSLDRAMDNLQGVILSRLRRVLLLPQASYENGQMICSRILRAFARQFPHSPARLQISVQPLLSSG